MSRTVHDIDWLEDRLDVFDRVKSGLSLDLHNRRHKVGLTAYVLCSCSALALAVSAFALLLPNTVFGGLYRAGANVDFIMKLFGVLAIGCCAAAVLFSRGALRFAAAAIAAAVTVVGIVTLLMLPRGLEPIAIGDAKGLDSVNRFTRGSYTLVSDVKLTEGVNVKRFSGKLDGAGHTVSGGSGLRIGFNYGGICDIIIDKAEISADRSCILCGVNYGSIEGVTIGRGVSVNAQRCAMVEVNEGVISGCRADASYCCTSRAAGFALTDFGTIEQCEFDGVFIGCSEGFGGIVYQMGSGAVRSCIARGASKGCAEISGGIVCEQSGGIVEKCFVDMNVMDGSIYPVCRSAATAKSGSVIQCYAVSNERYELCGDSVQIPLSELSRARLLGFDFDNIWCFDENGVLRLRSSGAVPAEREPEVIVSAATAEPIPDETAEPTETPEPTVQATEQPPLTPEQKYGVLDVYPTDEELASGEREGTVTGGNINVRKGPSKDYAVVFTVRSGSKVKVLAVHGSWCFIEFNGQYGWMSKTKIGF